MTNNIQYRPSPSITIALFCYNQESYIEDALNSVLNQDYSPLNIIISDDCSKDNTTQIILTVLKNYNGPHKVVFNQNAENFGLIKHINYVSSLVDTDLLVAAAGDDISLPNRVSEIVHAYCLAPTQPTSIYSSVTKLSPEGILSDILIPPIENIGHGIEDCALKDALIIGAAHAWHKSIYEIFGDITELGAYEDLVIAYRSAILEGLLYIDKPLVNYRVSIGISTPKLPQNKKDRRRAKLQYVSNHMIPIIKQRIIDSKYIKNDDLKKYVYKELRRYLNKLQTIDSILSGTSDKNTLISAINNRNFYTFIKYYLYTILNRI